MTQDEILEMAIQAGIPSANVPSLAFGRVETGIELLEAFAKLVAEKDFEEGFYAGFKASGEGWNGECPFNNLGLDIQQNESIQHELKLAIRARGQV